MATALGNSEREVIIRRWELQGNAEIRLVRKGHNTLKGQLFDRDTPLLFDNVSIIGRGYKITGTFDSPTLNKRIETIRNLNFALVVARCRFIKFVHLQDKAFEIIKDKPRTYFELDLDYLDATMTASELAATILQPLANSVQNRSGTASQSNSTAIIVPAPIPTLEVDANIEQVPPILTSDAPPEIPATILENIDPTNVEAVGMIRQALGILKAGTPEGIRNLLEENESLKLQNQNDVGALEQRIASGQSELGQSKNTISTQKKIISGLSGVVVGGGGAVAIGLAVPVIGTVAGVGGVLGMLINTFCCEGDE